MHVQARQFCWPSESMGHEERGWCNRNKRVAELVQEGRGSEEGLLADPKLRLLYACAGCYARPLFGCVSRTDGISRVVREKKVGGGSERTRQLVMDVFSLLGFHGVEGQRSSLGTTYGDTSVCLLANAD